MTQLAIRLDRATEMALGRLVEQTGHTRSDVVREAIVSLDRSRLLAQMRQESVAVAHDDADRAEASAVLADMRTRRAW